MSPDKVFNHTDVVMVYQDREVVEPTIKQIMELGLDFKAYKHNPKIMHDMAKMEPNVLLLSSNDVKTQYSTISIIWKNMSKILPRIVPYC